MKINHIRKAVIVLTFYATRWSWGADCQRWRWEQRECPDNGKLWTCSDVPSSSSTTRKYLQRKRRLPSSKEFFWVFFSKSKFFKRIFFVFLKASREKNVDHHFGGNFEPEEKKLDRCGCICARVLSHLLTRRQAGQTNLVIGRCSKFDRKISSTKLWWDSLELAFYSS